MTFIAGGGGREAKDKSIPFHNPYHILKLSQFIIGIFSCILIPGTVKPNWLHVFQRFTLGIPQIKTASQFTVNAKQENEGEKCVMQRLKAWMG